MVEIDNYIRRLKSSWIKRFVKDCKLKLIQLLQEYRINFDKTLYLGSDIINTLLKDFRNPFWKDTFIPKYTSQKWGGKKEWIYQPIWYNKNIKIANKSLFYEQ